MNIGLGDGKGIFEVVDETPEQCEEAAVLALFIASIYTHPHVHFWSNGVAQLIDGKSNWKVADVFKFGRTLIEKNTSSFLFFNVSGG